METCVDFKCIDYLSIDFKCREYLPIIEIEIIYIYILKFLYGLIKLTLLSFYLIS